MPTWGCFQGPSLSRSRPTFWLRNCLGLNQASNPKLDKPYTLVVDAICVEPWGLYNFVTADIAPLTALRSIYDAYSRLPGFLR